MVRIYTKKGDDGSTSLWYGGRKPKSNPRIDAYGAVDEAGSALGVARSLCGPEERELRDDVLRLQSELFVCGAELATAPAASDRLEEGVSEVTDEMVEWLEERIDAYMDRVELPPKFVIAGGTRLSAQLDFARAVIRRAERRVVAMQEAEELEPGAVQRYLNRANDLAYAMARFADVDDPELFEGRG